ncbi:MAG: metalloregulator ArsR/SmtB family transcription factor [Candidatus Accumulibacter phosphatis]|uniref:Biofilm growth-associated repressor n=3 Tax=Candidatus Accumulibacter TaxID=327159 RepID=A0A080MD92_9PROT|nr:MULTISPECIES: metalloregulator ArsR/SmtB family transcription factor [Candidatus Accumulibacter]KFB75169.1 MAG: Biofilm growth-associated repressor [Candidatus Accumulibacter cognatus]MCC2868985.1 metalloregulator ArsR/SmtB family transcription factor [Candidatus Accumulibacter phosphatis]MCM8581076.1 metalloregulator ArsR/SmtB family transcription factor [Accumulibacter sp.]MCQ1549321.1 metalloregulator ArsR/SmtB family transcription factor [Candidatus Accumulibacter phosphatis]TMQ74563.1 
MDTTTLDIESMRAAAGRATAVLGVLANTNRLLLMCQLSQGEKCVGELEELLDLHQPTLSQQLGVLRSEGLVNTRRDGKKIYYSVADARVLALLATLYEMYCPQAGGENP